MFFSAQNLEVMIFFFLDSLFLQDEMKELKEQLTMYESASQFGITSSINGSTLTTVGKETTVGASATRLDDSYAQLGIKKPESLLDDG